MSDYHPAFHTTDHHPEDTDNTEDAAAGSAVTAARTAVEDAIELFTLLDWHPRTARAGIEHICSALTRASSRQAAYEALRRDKHARALLDIPGESWTAMLKALLGHPDAAYAATNAGRGVLLRLLIGESLPMLLRDEDLVVLIAFTAPGQPRTSGGQ